MTPAPWLHFLGGRSFVLCLAGNFISSLLVWYGKIGAGEWLAFGISTTGAFIGSMALQNRTQVRAEVDKAVAGVQTESQQSGNEL